MRVERSVAGRTLRTECAERNARRAGSALEAFERVPALEPGAELRFGWSELRLEAGLDGALEVTEPDFAAWPRPRRRTTIDVTLDVLEAQVGLLGRIGVDGEDVAFDQVVLAAQGALDEPQVFLRRTAALSPQDSGWLAGRLDDPEALARAEELEAVPVAALVARRFALLQVLTLPQDFVAVFAGDSVDRVFDAAGREWPAERLRLPC